MTYNTPESFGASSREVLLRVVNKSLPCSFITYYPDPQFTSFTTLNIEGGVRVTMQVTASVLKVTLAQLTEVSET